MLRRLNPILFNYRRGKEELRRVDQISGLGVLLDAKLGFIQHRTEPITKAKDSLALFLTLTEISTTFSVLGRRIKHWFALYSRMSI